MPESSSRCEIFRQVVELNGIRSKQDQLITFIANDRDQPHRAEQGQTRWAILMMAPVTLETW